MLHRASAQLRQIIRLGVLVGIAATSVESKADIVADWNAVATDVLIANPAAQPFVQYGHGARRHLRRRERDRWPILGLRDPSTIRDIGRLR